MDGFQARLKEVLALRGSMPRRVVRQLRTLDPVELAAAAGVPFWAAWARLRMPGISDVLRAA